MLGWISGSLQRSHAVEQYEAGGSPVVSFSGVLPVSESTAAPGLLMILIITSSRGMLYVPQSHKGGPGRQLNLE